MCNNQQELKKVIFRIFSKFKQQASLNYIKNDPVHDKLVQTAGQAESECMGMDITDEQKAMIEKMVEKMLEANEYALCRMYMAGIMDCLLFLYKQGFLDSIDM